MKKWGISILLFTLLIFGGSTISQAKDDSSALKKEIATLQAKVKKLNKQVNSKNTEINKLKVQLNEQKVISNTYKTHLKNANTQLKELSQTLNQTITEGNIYQNGVLAGNSQFITMGNKTFVEVNSLVPVLSSYTNDQINFNTEKTELYLGTEAHNNTVNLTDIYAFYLNENIRINNWFNGDNFSINNKKYYSGIANEWGSGEIEYKLNGQYSQLEFNLGIDDRDVTNKRGNIRIEGDGNIIYDSYDADDNLERQEDARKITLDVTGINKLFITFYSGETPTVMADAILTPIK